MILVLFGQPCSGKTTLAQELPYNHWLLDGDNLRAIFQDKDFSREGRIKNLNRASDIAVFQHSIHSNGVTVSMVYPYQEARDYLTSMCKRLNIDLTWVYLTYNEERGRESFHVKDFEIPHLDEITLMINTSVTPVKECVREIINHIN